jgi:hypothetical protein
MLNLQHLIQHVLHELRAHMEIATILRWLMALPILVDGAALDATSFGEEDDDGYWNPIDFTGVTTQKQPDLTGSSNIGNMTGGGGLAAAFDGITSQASTAGAALNNSSSDGTVGKDWGSGNTKTINKAVIIGPNDTSIVRNSIDSQGATTVYLEASTDNFSASTVSLASASTSTASGEVVVLETSGASAYRYHRIRVQAIDGSSDCFIAEVQFYEDTNSSYGTNGGAYDFADTKSFGLDVSDPLVTFQDAYNISGLHFDGTDASTTFTDETGRAWTQGGSAIISTTESKFGGSSLYLGDNTEKWYVTTADTTELDFAGDFTVESWVYFNEFGVDATSVQGAWFTKAGGSRTSLASASGSSAYCCGFNGSTQLAFYMNANSGPVFSFSALSLNTWYHVALTRNGNNWYLFIDGVQVGGTQSNSNVPTTNAEPFDIGRSATYSGGNWYYPGRHTFSGYIDDFQISNFAKYTAGFTPLTRAFYSNNTFGPIGFATTDQLADTPTDSADEGIGNFATWNPLISGGATLSLANKRASIPADKSTAGTIAVNSGKWRFQAKLITLAGTYDAVGIAGNQNDWDTHISYSGGYPEDVCTYQADGRKAGNSAYTAYGSTFTTNDVIDVFFDADTGTVWFAKNGTLQASATETEVQNGTTTNAAFTGVAFDGWGSKQIYPVVTLGGSGTSVWDVEFDAAKFTYSYSGITSYLALATQNFPAPTIADGADYFNTVLYTGDNAATHAITGVGFAPDLVWLKGRTTGGSLFHHLGDTVRGANKALFSNATNAENTDTNRITAFGSDGFTVGANSAVNDGTTYTDFVAWCWKAGGAAVVQH